MFSRTSVRALRLACAAVVAAGPLAALNPSHVAAASSPSAASSAVVRMVEREGRCKKGPGDWELRVQRRGRSLRIEFEVDDIARRQKWQLFLSDNGRRVAAVTRHSGVSGSVEVRRLTRNRRGRDRISAAAVHARTGNTCSGRLRF